VFRQLYAKHFVISWWACGCKSSSRSLVSNSVTICCRSTQTEGVLIEQHHQKPLRRKAVAEFASGCLKPCQHKGHAVS